MSEEGKNQNSDSRASLEVIAPSIEEAVEKGLSDLGLDEDAVDIEVLDEGSRGVLGLGSRQARVRLTVKTPAGSDDEAEKFEEAESLDGGEVEGVEEPVGEEESEAAAEVDEDEAQSQQSIEEDIALHIAQETVIDLLERMHIDADVDAYYAEPDDDRSRAPLCVDISGEDLSILIGHWAETLNALQYITNLILGKELGRSAPLVVDVQGYRKRRAEEVKRVANRMAEQAVKSGRRQYLEPMPPSERRLVHIELRKNPDVETESVGEDPKRKVTIIPLEPEEY